MKFIPVRGRKRVFVLVVVLSAVEIYPREGTETIALLYILALLIVEIYPREGTETIADIIGNCFFHVEIYPREGTETTGYLYRLAHVHG